MLSKCVNCGFYVRQDDEFCLNCGVEKPLLNPNLSKPAIIQSLVVFLISSVFFLITWYLLFPKLKFLYEPFGLGLAVAFTFFIAYETYKSRTIAEQEKSNSNNLRNKEILIQKRINELGKRGKLIDSVLDRISHNDSLHLQQVRQKLLSAREIVIGQFARYELQYKKIELVRLQNEVSPYLFGINRLNESEMENGLVTIENTKTAIYRIRQNLTRYDAIDFPRKVLPEKEAFLSQLDETETSCERLREVLLSRQATLALRGISPIEEAVKLPASKELMREADVFNIQTTITDFSESFEELEREYRRLKSEDEISRLTDFQD